MGLLQTFVSTEVGQKLLFDQFQQTFQQILTKSAKIETEKKSSFILYLELVQGQKLKLGNWNIWEQR